MRVSNRGLLLSACLAVVGAAGTPALALELPDGDYVCTFWNGGSPMNLGTIQIDGDTYRGPAYDGDYEGTYSLEVTDAGTINWGGPLGGMSSDGFTPVSSVVKQNGDDLAFDVTVQLPNGNFTTTSCMRE